MIFEDIFIRDLIFDRKSNVLHSIPKLDLENIIKIGSKHLILPLIFVKIREKNLLDIFPNDFCKYLEFLYNANIERNKILIREVNLLNDLLKKNNFNPIFLKGSSNIIMVFTMT